MAVRKYPHRLRIETATDPGVVTNIQEIQFAVFMLPYERPYRGFYPYRINSTEITLRSVFQMRLFNDNIQKARE